MMALRPLPASALANADPMAPAPMIPMVLITMLLVKGMKQMNQVIKAAGVSVGKEKDM
jgi:hypothetical protein